MSNRRVLVIDDSVTARISIKKMLTNKSCEVFMAHNGLDALFQVKETNPDLILLDLSMPVWDGFSVLCILKNRKETAAIPVVVLSGKEGLGDKVRAHSLGAADFIIKPCSDEALSNTLNKLPIKS